MLKSWSSIWYRRITFLLRGTYSYILKIILKPDLILTQMAFKRLRRLHYWVSMLSFKKEKITHLSNLEFVAGRADQVHKAKPVTDCYLKAIPCFKGKKKNYFNISNFINTPTVAVLNLPFKIPWVISTIKGYFSVFIPKCCNYQIYWQCFYESTHSLTQIKGTGIEYHSQIHSLFSLTQIPLRYKSREADSRYPRT